MSTAYTNSTSNCCTIQVYFWFYGLSTYHFLQPVDSSCITLTLPRFTWELWFHLLQENIAKLPLQIVSKATACFLSDVLLPCRGGEACVPQWPWELYRQVSYSWQVQPCRPGFRVEDRQMQHLLLLVGGPSFQPGLPPPLVQRTQRQRSKH